MLQATNKQANKQTNKMDGPTINQSSKQASKQARWAPTPSFSFVSILTQ
jgi:hypothetical protein